MAPYENPEASVSAVLRPRETERRRLWSFGTSAFRFLRPYTGFDVGTSPAHRPIIPPEHPSQRLPGYTGDRGLIPWPVITLAEQRGRSKGSFSGRVNADIFPIFELADDGMTPFRAIEVEVSRSIVFDDTSSIFFDAREPTVYADQGPRFQISFFGVHVASPFDWREHNTGGRFSKMRILRR